MASKRLEEINSLLDIEDALIDVGCDHAYVAIAHAKKGAKKILATDIHENALKIAFKNIKKEGLEKKIECKLSDGLKEIDAKNYNTIVLAGMGFYTIKHILSETKKLENIKKIIIQSNDNISDVRKFMRKLNYKIDCEKIVFEKNHYYVIMLYTKGKQHLTKTELEYGIFNQENKEYYQYLYQKQKEILRNIPKHFIFNRYQLRIKQYWIKNWIKKCAL